MTLSLAADVGPAAAETAAQPKPMRVSALLSRMSRFEPSGVTWVSHLKRFVIVSDDTGFKHQNKHAPWLFSMDRKGHVDPKPLVVSGIKKFNDLESIAPVPGKKGALYVLSSQSYSKKGRRKHSRQSFCRLDPAGRSFRVTRRIRLAELLDAGGTKLYAKLGITSTRDLNIEGMTTWSKAALLLGLKAPLDANKNALIWRIEHPDKLLASGNVAASLSLWGKVKLHVEARGRRVPGGISELLQLPDGRLVIAATASEIKTRRQSGSLWVVPASKGGQLEARRFRVFSGRKPEGLSLSPRKGHLLVVFDAGKRVPSFLEIPWPRK